MYAEFIESYKMYGYFAVLLLRGGFILVQVGSIPVENAYMIIFRNIIEIAVTIFSYGFIGFYLSFGKKSFHGIINYDGYIGNIDADLSAAALGNFDCATNICNSVFYYVFHFIFLLHFLHFIVKYLTHFMESE